MNKEILIVAKQLLLKIKVARRSDTIITRCILESDFGIIKDDLEKLEQLCGWDKSDDELVGKLVAKFKEEVDKGKNSNEKWQVLKKILKTGSIISTIAIGVAGVGLASQIIKNKKAKE